MSFVVVTGQTYRCLYGRDRGRSFRVMAVSPDGEVALNRIQPGPWGYFSGSIVVTDTSLADASAWERVLEEKS